MARQTAWVLAAALACATPASAAFVCDRAEPLAQGQQGAKPAPGKNQKRDQKQDEHHPWKFWQGEAQTELGITAQQSAEIEQIFRSTMPKIEASKQIIDKLEAALSQTIKDTTADLATVGQQIDRLEVARAELYKTRTLMLYRMRGTLSADQRARLQAMFDKWDASRRKSSDASGRR
jgi:Spy/CpxP family protein refolding chaperone